jgi:flagellar biosynthesis protein FlgN
MPPASANPTAIIGQLMGDEIASLQDFVRLLRREQELLKQNDSEELLALIASKNELTNKLGELAQAREKQLMLLGLPTGRAGVNAWLDHHASEADHHAWKRLLELTGDARDLNAINGKLIGLHMQHNQQALDALLAATDKASTYGPDGQQQSGLGSRILGKA